MRGKSAPSNTKNRTKKSSVNWIEELAGIATEEEVQEIARNISLSRGYTFDIGEPPKDVYRGALAQKRFKELDPKC